MCDVNLNHRGSYIGWPTRETRPRAGAARRQRPKSATAAKATAPPKKKVPAAPVDSVISQIVREWGSVRKASLAAEIDLRKQLQAQAQRIIALEAELEIASVNIEQRNSTSCVTKTDSIKHKVDDTEDISTGQIGSFKQDLTSNVTMAEPCKNKVDGTEDTGTSQTGSITLSPLSIDMEEADIRIILNSYTTPRWRAKSEQLGIILAETILDKTYHVVQNEVIHVTLCCFMGEDGDRIVKSILDNTENRSWIEVIGSCTCFCISLDRAAVKSLLDAKLDGSQSYNGFGKPDVFQSAGTLLLDLIGSHMLMLVDQYVGDVKERNGHAVMC